MKIRDDLYWRVFELVTALVNATESFDRRANWERYNELRELVESEAAAGRPHPFLFEALADFTDDDRIALELYRTALAHASAPDADEYRASIQLAMAERCKNLGESAQAWEHASRANDVAKGLDDLELRQRISEFLLSESKNAR